MGLLCCENCMILTSTVFDWSTRVTDRRTDRRNCDSICALSIYAVARKNYVCFWHYHFFRRVKFVYVSYREKCYFFYLKMHQNAIGGRAPLGSGKEDWSLKPHWEVLGAPKVNHSTGVMLGMQSNTNEQPTLGWLSPWYSRPGLDYPL